MNEHEHAWMGPWPTHDEDYVFQSCGCGAYRRLNKEMFFPDSLEVVK